MQTTITQPTPGAPAVHAAKSTLKINRLDGPFGAEAIGVDLTRPVDEDTRRRLNDAVVEHIALVVRDQHFTPEQFLEASRVFGEPLARPNGSDSLSDLPIVHRVSSRQVDSLGLVKRTGEAWHTDHTNLEEVTNYTILYPEELPVSGGGTWVCNTREAYEALPAELKKKVDDMKTANVIHGSATRDNGRGVSDQVKAQAKENPTPVVHPMVRTHPVTGKRAVNFNPTKLENIVGMDPEDSQDFLEFMTEQLTKPEFVYTHQWRMGDMFLWDNRSSLHRAGHDYEIVGDRHRTLLRIIIAGEKPY